jgi:hypothetical protein
MEHFDTNNEKDIDWLFLHKEETAAKEIDNQHLTCFRIPFITLFFN